MQEMSKNYCVIMLKKLEQNKNHNCEQLFLERFFNKFINFGEIPKEKSLSFSSHPFLK